MASDMHPEDIKAEIRKRGYTMTELALANGMAKQSIGEAIRVRSSARAEKIIADLLEMKPREIWPSRYRADGKRIFLRAPHRQPEKADAAA